MNLQSEQLNALSGYVRDSIKLQDLKLHCEHSEALYDDLEVCPTCGTEMAEWYAEQAEERLSDEAKAEYYREKYND